MAKQSANNPPVMNIAVGTALIQATQARARDQAIQAMGRLVLALPPGAFLFRRVGEEEDLRARLETHLRELEAAAAAPSVPETKEPT